MYSDNAPIAIMECSLLQQDLLKVDMCSELLITHRLWNLVGSIIYPELNWS